MSEQGDELYKRLEKVLNEHGVSQWVFAFSDPDDAVDVVAVQGSKLWRAGVGMDLIDDVKAARRKERDER